MSRPFQLLLLAAAVGFTGVVLLVVGVDRYRSRPDHVQIVPPGDEVRYDDFAFAVLDSHEEATLGRDGQVRPQQRFVVVTLRVANHAKRVAHRFQPSRILLVGEDERSFSLSPVGLAALRESEADGCAAELPPGSSCTTRLVYDVPRAGTLRARVGTNLALFDMLDRVIYGKKLLALE